MFFLISVRKAERILLRQSWAKGIGRTATMYAAGSTVNSSWCLDTGAKLGVNHDGEWFIYGYNADGHDLLPYADLLPCARATVTYDDGYTFEGIFENMARAEAWAYGWRGFPTIDVRS